MTLPDWQLPPGVDRGLWDYLRSGEMVAGYDAQVSASPLAAADVRFCEEVFPTPGRLLDLGCGTGRLCVHFTRMGFDCVGVDLSEEMLTKARAFPGVTWVKANLAGPLELPGGPFDYAACLFSTLGMVRGGDNRRAVLANAFRALRPGGRFVLHAHNRWYPALGWRRFRSADVTMPQAYGGAPLTLRHFTRREVVGLLREAGFDVNDVRAVSADDGPPGWRPYGYLLSGGRPA